VSAIRDKLNATVFGNITTLTANANLGRLTTMTGRELRAAGC
jgi:hypothetical protein